MSKTIQKTSRLLSLFLRHNPEKIAIKLSPQGWVDVDFLLDRMNASGHALSREQLQEVVRTSDKKRFTFSEDGKMIRAAQGHSVEVDLDLSPKEPPATLFHGTAIQNVTAIMLEGLKPGQRQQVHLSSDAQTATRVGQRHGQAVVLMIDAAHMHADGLHLYQADNGVWLTDHVPTKYLNQNNGD